MKGWFVTGTDTEIGKTCVSAGLAHVLVQRGWRVGAVKPLAAGQVQDAEGRWFNEDVRQLHAAQSAGLSEADVGPLQFRAPCAPHIAARMEGRAIDRTQVLERVRAAAARADVTVVEGVGGFRVPLCDGWDTADLARDLGLPVVLVVGLRLGCINHAALTAEAVRARGLTLAGWVANTLEAPLPHLTENLSALQNVLGTPCWGHVPRLHPPTAAAVAAHLNPDAVPARF
jgi:dethiobiotin synthetase